jgi:ABC-type uncharacterized transport system permease subunit
MVVSNTLATELTFIEVLFAIIIGQLLVGVWQTALENYTFNTLKLNKESTYHTMIIALVTTFIFLFYLFSAPSVFYAIFETDTGNNLQPPDPRPKTSVNGTLSETLPIYGINGINDNMNDINDNIKLF